MRSVAIVFAEDFSAQLEKLSVRTAVWLADTPANHTAAEAAWQRAIEWPQISVTLFRPPSETSADDWRTLLEQITLREGTVDAMDVIGTPLSLAARAVIDDAGFSRVEETPLGFRARR